MSNTDDNITTNAATTSDDISRNEFVFNGTVVERSDENVTVQVVPGLVLDVRTDDIAVLEEETDPLTQRTYVHIRLRDGAEMTMNFKPRLARLSAEAERVPFVLGGRPQSDEAVHGMPGGGVPALPPLIDVAGAPLFESTAALGGSNPLPVLDFFRTTDSTTFNCQFTTPFETANKFGRRTLTPEGVIADVDPFPIDTKMDDGKLDTIPDTGLFR